MTQTIYICIPTNPATRLMSPSFKYYWKLTREGGGLASLGMDDKVAPYCQRILTPVREVTVPVGSMVLADEAHPWRKRMEAHGMGHPSGY